MDAVTRFAFAALSTVFLTTVIAFVATAQQPPQCTQGTLGMTACLGDKMCECQYVRGGQITGLPDGFKWDCGINRPQCGVRADTPATIDTYKGPYPNAVAIDRSDNSTTVTNNN